MIFAAGFGVRLRPLTAELPKPALPVANLPLGWFALDYLARNGVDDVAINAHHLADLLREKISPYIPKSLSVRFVHEPVILGTGGGLKNAWRPAPGETFVALNGDMLFEPNLDAALDAHRRLGAIATMVLRPLTEPERYRPVEMDAEGRVRRILGFPQSAAGPLETYMFTGVHLLHPRAWPDLPVDGCIIRASYLRWLERGEVVAGVVDDSLWMDVGAVEDYLEANCALASGRAQRAGIARDPAGVIRDPSATVGKGALLSQVVLGPNSYVAPGSRLRRVVLWEAARAEENIENAVITRAGIVRG